MSVAAKKVKVSDLTLALASASEALKELGATADRAGKEFAAIHDFLFWNWIAYEFSRNGIPLPLPSQEPKP